MCECACVSTPVSKVFNFYFAGDLPPNAQEPLVSLAPTKTLTIGCVNVPAGTPWAPSCAAWVPIRTSIFNPVSLAHKLSDAFDSMTNGRDFSSVCQPLFMCKPKKHEFHICRPMCAPGVAADERTALWWAECPESGWTCLDLSGGCWPAVKQQHIV